MAALIGRKELSWNLYIEALKSDFEDIQGGTTAEGIHMGVMTGTVMMALTAFAGLNLNGNQLKLSPCLPKHWRELTFKCTFRGVEYSISIKKGKVFINCAKDGEKVTVNGKEFTLKANEEIEIS